MILFKIFNEFYSIDIVVYITNIAKLIVYPDLACITSLDATSHRSDLKLFRHLKLISSDSFGAH